MDDTSWKLVEVERRSLADLLETFTTDQWEAPSLCSEWHVRDVAAHLAMTGAGAPSLGTMANALVRTRGGLWDAGRDVAISYAAARPTSQIIRELRRDAAFRRKPLFVVPDNILPDLLVHGQDIAVPLGVVREIPPQAGKIALDRIWTMGWPFRASRRLQGLSLHAEDANWMAGNGPDVRGKSAALLLLMTGRTSTAVDMLRGPGVDLVRSRLAPALDERR